ncbi:transcriptional regulator [Georgenia thermotolerans]|uniref:Transcriptional regulator n=1 Tax=Georgenia thermotolerans TaxID=527326 RepID=A0A7J5UJU2_9MICO|nr:transcriptional regulator [Georgenia thermotolerans]KAE8762531.1 transcriptional regulator [Georgenia thermotolerans]
MALSEADRRRLAAGELASEVDALHQGDAPPVTPSAEPEQGTGENDARLLRDVPPHWGRR